MDVTFTSFDAATDLPALIEFHTTNTFPFHVVVAPTREVVEERHAKGKYSDADHHTMWIDVSGRGRVGLAVIEDLTDNAPILDIRLADQHRGAGLGVPVLEAIVVEVFTRWPKVTRFEGHTREDNLAMRKTFLRAGFVKEAHHRDGWPVMGGELKATITYAVLRRDWASGTTTPVVWDAL